MTARVIPMLRVLAAHPEGLSTPELMAECAMDIHSRQQALSQTASAMRSLEAGGRAMRTGALPGAWQRPPTVIWCITEKGVYAAMLAILADMRNTADVGRIRELGEEGRQAARTLRIIFAHSEPSHH